MIYIFNKISKDVLILALGKILQIFIALFSVRLLTTFLSDSEVGNYYLLLTLLTLFNFAFLNPIGQYYNRYVLSWKAKGMLANANAALLLARVIGVFLSLISGLMIYQVFDYSKLFRIDYFFIFILVSLISSSYLAFLNVINLIGNRLCFIKYLLLYLFLGIFISIIINLYISNSGMAWLYGVAISQIIIFIPMYKNVAGFDTLDIRLLFKNITAVKCKKILLFSCPVMITLFLQWGQNSSYRLIIEDKYSVEILSYIAVGLAVSTSIFTAVESLATQYFMPIYLNNISDGNIEERSAAWNQLASYMLPIYFLLMIYVVCLAPFLMKVLVNERFYESYIYMIFGAFIEFFRVSSNLIYLVSQSEVKTKTTILPYLIGFLIMIFSLYFIDASKTLWLVPTIISFSYFLTTFMLYFNMKKLLFIRMPIKNLFLSSFMCIPFVFLFFFNKDVGIIESLFFIVFFGFFFLLGVFLVLKKNNI